MAKPIPRCFLSVAFYVALAGQADAWELPDLALLPPEVITEPGPDHVKSSRGAQGVPAIERTAKGRLWASWYAGKSRRGVESSSSYVVLATSGDDGATWTETLVLQAPRFCHTYDPCLWIDPGGRLWCFWAQSAGVQDGRMGVWALVTDNADSRNPEWSPPRRIANGVMLNKPTVLGNGDWLLPIGLWRDNTNVPNVSFDPEKLAPYTLDMLIHDLGEERGSNVFRSTDQGKTFERIGQVRVPGTRVDEHMVDATSRSHPVAGNGLPQAFAHNLTVFPLPPAEGLPHRAAPPLRLRAESPTGGPGCCELRESIQLGFSRSVLRRFERTGYHGGRRWCGGQTL